VLDDMRFLRSQMIAFDKRADRSPVVGSCSQIMQNCAGCCPDCKQNQNCPCRRASSRREPSSRFALGLLFARFARFETSFDPFQASCAGCSPLGNGSNIRRQPILEYSSLSFQRGRRCGGERTNPARAVKRMSAMTFLRRLERWSSRLVATPSSARRLRGWIPTDHR
jgi:hypothetical protein